MVNPMMEVQLANLKKQHDNDAGELKKLEQQIGKMVENISEYSRQKMENEMVLKELVLLADDGAVFKQIGPCLIKQDSYEAKSNVEKRIEYIAGEIDRIEKQKAAADEKRKKRIQSINKIQQDLQKMVAAQAQSEKQTS